MPHVSLSTLIPVAVRNLLSREEHARVCDLVAIGRWDAARDYVINVLDDNDLIIPDGAFLPRSTTPAAGARP